MIKLTLFQKMEHVQQLLRKIDLGFGRGRAGREEMQGQCWRCQPRWLWPGDPRIHCSPSCGKARCSFGALPPNNPSSTSRAWTTYITPVTGGGGEPIPQFLQYLSSHSGSCIFSLDLSWRLAEVLPGRRWETPNTTNWDSGENSSNLRPRPYALDSSWKGQGLS